MTSRSKSYLTNRRVTRWLVIILLSCTLTSQAAADVKVFVVEWSSHYADFLSHTQFNGSLVGSGVVHGEAWAQAWPWSNLAADYLSGLPDLYACKKDGSWVPRSISSTQSIQVGDLWGYSFGDDSYSMTQSVSADGIMKVIFQRTTHAAYNDYGIAQHGGPLQKELSEQLVLTLFPATEPTARVFVEYSGYNSRRWSFSPPAAPQDDVGSISGTGGGSGAVTGEYLRQVQNATTFPPECYSVGVQLIDPVPDLLVGSRIDANPTRLAEGGRVVHGVVADGVTQVVIRIVAVTAGEEFDVSIESPKGDNGYLALPTTPTFTENVVTAVAVATPVGQPMAFAVYQAPADFPTLGSPPSAESLSRRTILTVRRRSDGIVVAEVPIVIFRPPVVLVHGQGSGPLEWETFLQAAGGTLIERLSNAGSITRADYSREFGVESIDPPLLVWSALKLVRNTIPGMLGSMTGFTVNAPSVLRTIERTLVDFRRSMNVAVTQVDIVAHSMGGLVSRQLPWLADFFDDKTFRRGRIHKLITIGTPHRGSPLAAAILDPANSCVRALLFMVLPATRTVTTTLGAVLPGSIAELQPDSSALDRLRSPYPSFVPDYKIPTAMIAGVMTQNQLDAVESSTFANLIHGLCVSHFPFSEPLAHNLSAIGWSSVMGEAYNDGVVPYTSQIDGSIGTEPRPLVEAVHSSGIAKLFAEPYEHQVAPGRVAELLNTHLSKWPYEGLPR